MADMELPLPLLLLLLLFVSLSRPEALGPHRDPNVPESTESVIDPVSGQQAGGQELPGMSECPGNQVVIRNGTVCGCVDDLVFDRGNCSCADGLRLGLDPRQCVDMDECAGTPSPCGPASNCTNTLGSFLCVCNPGFLMAASGCEDLLQQ
ncbi:adhesion G protein-coupled receptor E1-like [Scyliorhinus canicula]|uniref:adhesion G protein-coupled receptor E1-like n=1 Tax=Scyliorhinus canicula TaxID=7830 RepID=UPI0018F6CC3A|nr:adhesion G protein-coupled receptor E1-like [Scyliorhinus canicula]